jgi:short-subunit dehydrogenase involved in D-alanine esterification of teichoic acids
MSFSYKCVLMVGATSGIGLGMAEKLIREGSKVIAVGRRQDRIDDFVRKHGSKADGFAYDINDAHNLNNFVQTITTKHSDLDCLFLNAGIQATYDLTKPTQVDLSAFHNEVSVNFTSFVNLSLAFLPFLQSKQYPTSIVL